MKNLTFTLTILLILFYNEQLKSQGGGGVTSLIVALSQRSTVLYSDTIFEQDGLKFKITETYAFRNKIKMTFIITNISEQFKILHSDDISITDSENKPITIFKKKPMVIGPGGEKIFGILAESKSFKLYDIKVNIKQIYTAGKIEAIHNPGLFKLYSDGGSYYQAGNLSISSTKCIAIGDLTKAYIKVIYTGTNFLGIHGSKAKLQTSEGKIYYNEFKKSKAVSYPEGKIGYAMLFEFKNPSPSFNTEPMDRINFENVFVEYSVSGNNTPFEFHVHKKGMSDGDEPKEKKEKKKEPAED
ncbi:MAG: hypothetical protein V4565_07445 [Bacteroidota bacterium]